LLFRLLLFSVWLAPYALGVQSVAVSDTPARPAILGNLEHGKYSNHVIGFEIQLDPTCAFADESRAIARATQLPQRLSLAIECGDNLIVLSSFPFYPDEEVNLRRDAGVSLQGAVDGGGFKKRGGWQSLKTGGIDVLVQELARHGKSGNEVGFYHAFVIGRRYVSILAIGPEANRARLTNAAATLAVEQNQAPSSSESR
jgi:hypothetical protein